MVNFLIFYGGHVGLFLYQKITNSVIYYNLYHVFKKCIQVAASYVRGGVNNNTYSSELYVTFTSNTL